MNENTTAISNAFISSTYYILNFIVVNLISKMKNSSEIMIDKKFTGETILRNLFQNGIWLFLGVQISLIFIESDKYFKNGRIVSCLFLFLIICILLILMR